MIVSTGRQRATVTLLYLFGVISMAVIGLISPLAVRLVGDLHARPEAIGLTIALFSLPSAASATIGGLIVDRLGPRQVLLGALLLIAAAEFMMAISRSLWLFDAGMLLVGTGFVGIVIGVPAIMMATLEGARRARSLAFWSTYGPVGFSLGLLMAVPFTGTVSWRLGIGLHAMFMLALMVAAWFVLPDVSRTIEKAISQRPAPTGARQLFVALREPRALRLSIALSMPNMISYGTSLIAVLYLSEVHHVPLAASATTVAVAKIIAMLIGGSATGAILARGVTPQRLFTAMIVLGIIAQTMLYLPMSPLPVAVAGLMLWLLAYAGQCGVCMAAMPVVATEGGLKRGELAGLVNQIVSIGSFLAPTIYFARPGWLGLVGLAVVGSLVSLISLPATKRATLVLAPGA